MNNPSTHSTSLTLSWQGQSLIALGERGLFHDSSGTLYVADIHLGKASYFRAQGRPVPEGVTAHDFTRLSRMIEEMKASRLVVLGDLFHAPPASNDDTIASIRAWRETHASLECLLVKGNHDRRLGDVLANTGIELVNGPHQDGPFTLTHEPPDNVTSGAPTLCGHVHPAVRLTRRGRSTIRTACFWFTDRFAILPAFGRFTGTHVVRPRRVDRVIMVEASRVIEIAPSLCARRS